MVPYYFTRETTRHTRREMRKIFLQIEKEMGYGCPIQFVQTYDENDRRANIHIRQDSRQCWRSSCASSDNRQLPGTFHDCITMPIQLEYLATDCTPRDVPCVWLQPHSA